MQARVISVGEVSGEWSIHRPTLPPHRVECNHCGSVAVPANDGCGGFAVLWLR